MTVNEKIMAALDPFGIPVYADFYAADGNEYITFNYADDRAVDFGDDTPLHDVASMQIHWFLPRAKPHLENKRKIRAALFQAGFTYPAVTELIEQDESNSANDIRHVIFECEIEDTEALEGLRKE